MKNQAKKPRLLFLDASTVDLNDLDMSAFKQLGHYKKFDLLPDSSITNEASKADIIITNKCVLDAEKITSLSQLRLICVAATGVNNVDLDACRKNNIAVCNVAGYSTQTVAEHTFMFLLALAHRLQEHHQAATSGLWSQSPHFSVLDFRFSDLCGKTLGLIGYGSIGKKVAAMAKVFGMRVLVAALPGRKYPASQKRISHWQLLAESDYVSLHTSLHQNTFHLMGKKELSSMKKTACLINLSRGPVVDTKALVEALGKNKIRAYATDVLEQEPPTSEHPLLDPKLKEKVIITPHVAWASYESRQKLVNEMALNIEAFLKGKKRNRVV